MAAGKASQTTSVQIAHVFMLCCTTQSCSAYNNFDSLRSLSTLSILINNNVSNYIAAVFWVLSLRFCFYGVNVACSMLFYVISCCSL